MSGLFAKISYTKEKRMARRLLAFAMSAIVLFLQLPTSAYAQSDTFCGYVEHIHTGDCYTLELVCALEESCGHTHDAECYDEDGTLICSLNETEAHTHGEDCYSLTLSCGLSEHTHTLACYSDPNADVENWYYWKQMCAEAELSGVWSHDLVEVAKTQLGYYESTRNYTVVNGVKHGYTRYGDWFGVTYGDWCAMFISFCLEFAHIPYTAFPRHSNTERWVEALSSLGLYAQAGSYVPQTGDLVFFCSAADEQRKAIHVGIVTAADESSITTIEGNNGPVNYHSYALTDSIIIGYGVLPENPDYVPPPKGLLANAPITLFEKSSINYEESCLLDASIS